MLAFKVLIQLPACMVTHLPSSAPVGGVCTVPGDCTCRPGYHGDHCEYWEEGAELVAILSSSMGVLVAMVTMVMIIVVCATLRWRRQDKTRKMRSECPLAMRACMS